MSLLGKSADTKYFLSLNQADGPIELKDINVLATFDNRNVQANITTEKFTFTGAEANALRELIAKGLTGGVGLYEMPKYLIQAFNTGSNLDVFDGFLNLPEIEDLIEEVNKIRLSLVKEDGLNNFNQRLEGLTYGRLESEGIFTQSDYVTTEYVVEKKIQFLEVVIMSVTIYLMVKTLVDQIRNISTDISNFTAHAAGGLSGSIAAAIFAAVILAIEIAYAVALSIAIITLSTQIVQIFLPPVRKHKVITYRKMLENVVNYLGYNFISPIGDLDIYHNLPSNERLDDVDFISGIFSKLKGTPSGIPRPSDNGYNCSEFFDRCKKMFRAEFSIIGSDIHFRTLKDPWWIKQSTYKMPSSVIRPIKKYNSDELIESILIRFLTDITDEWTVDNFKGTNFEITTSPIVVKNPRALAIGGFETIEFQVALGNRKNELNALENVLSRLAGIVDSVVNTLGGSSNLSSSIKNKIGVLKVSQNDYSIQKVLALRGGRLPVNHRDILSAKYLYDTYINESSFVANNFGGQKTVYPGVRIPFGLNDFLKLINNSYGRDGDDNIIKFTKIEWNIDADFATADFYVKEAHSKNLKEEFIEVE